MSTKSLAKQRERLWREDPHCHYCGVETILKPNHVKGLTTPEERDRLATIDHIRPRHHPDRLKPANGEVLHVLACSKCNNERDKRELAEKPLEWHHAQSRAFPLAKCATEVLEQKLKYIAGIRPRGRSNRASVKRSQIAVLWALWERGIDLPETGNESY